MGLIGMPEAGRRLGVSTRSALRALKNAKIPLVAINQRAYAVEEADLQAFIDARGDYTFGRPVGSKGKPKVIEGNKPESAGQEAGGQDGKPE